MKVSWSLHFFRTRLYTFSEYTVLNLIKRNRFWDFKIFFIVCIKRETVHCKTGLSLSCMVSMWNWDVFLQCKSFLKMLLYSTFMWYNAQGFSFIYCFTFLYYIVLYFNHFQEIMQLFAMCLKRNQIKTIIYLVNLIYPNTFNPFLPNVSFWSPWKYQKTFGFLIFWGGPKGNIGNKRNNIRSKIWRWSLKYIETFTLTHFIPLVSLYTSWKHQKTIYQKIVLRKCQIKM